MLAMEGEMVELVAVVVAVVVAAVVAVVEPAVDVETDAELAERIICHQIAFLQHLVHQRAKCTTERDVSLVC